MKLIHCLAVASFAIGSCTKPNSPGPTPTSPSTPDTTKSTTPARPVDSLLAIHLTNPDTSGEYGANFELIISETAGKVLLDTVAAFNTNIVATLKTTEPRVNVTTIEHYLQNNNYDVYVRRSVKPALWTNLASPIVNSTPNPFPSNIVYTNVPAAADTINIDFSALGASYYFSRTYDAGQHRLWIGYTGRSGANYAYLQVPNLGLFSFQPIQTANDTVSLTHMDTTIKARLTKGAPTQLVVCFLSGYMDTTDMTKYLELYRWKYRLSADSIQYPSKSVVPVQKYFLYASSMSAIRNESYDYMAYSDTVPTTLPYPGTLIYVINSRLNTNFSISFLQKPTRYTTAWATGNIRMEVDAPPDSTTLNALDLANSLNSKMLRGGQFGGLQFVGAFEYTMVPGVDYDSWSAHQSDSMQALKPWPSVLYYHNYQP